jgi:hypothetical protein
MAARRKNVPSGNTAIDIPRRSASMIVSAPASRSDRSAFSIVTC